MANPGDGLFAQVSSNVTSATRPHQFVQVQLARNTGTSTQSASFTLSANAADCVFAAQAVVSPG